MNTKAKSEFDTELIGNLVHDLKTPLSAVKGFIELIQQTGPMTEKQEKFSNRALHGLKRMEIMISNLLEFARAESDIALDWAECDLKELVDDSMDLLTEIAAQRQLKIYIDIDPHAQIVYGDKRLLSHVLNNLVSNAIKYNRDGGAIWITSSGEVNAIRLNVRDSGIGISMEDQERVFERFFRARVDRHQRVDGSGLGLAIVQSIVQKHGGSISLDSALNEGTTFSIVLPREPGKNLAQAADFPARPLGGLRETSSEHIDDVEDWQQEAQEAKKDVSRADDI